MPILLTTSNRLDIVRAFAGAERMCFSQDVRDLVAYACDDMFEQVNGVPREIFLIIGDALEKSKEHMLGWLSWDEYQLALHLAKQKLYSWDPHCRNYPTSDPLWMAIAEAHKFACVLRILRLMDPHRPARDSEIQECVIKILDATAMISSDCSVIELVVLPLFMAGADCLSPHSRYYILGRLREIERRSEFRNPVPNDLLKKVWDARAAQSPDDDTNISWTTFVSYLSLAPIHSKLTDAYRYRLPGWCGHMTILYSDRLGKSYCVDKLDH